MPSRSSKLILAIVLVAGAGVAVAANLPALRRTAVKVVDQGYEPAAAAQGLVASFEGPDKDRAQVAIQLTQVADGFTQPVDLQFVPGDPRLLVVLEKAGRAAWTDLDSGQSGTLLSVDVLTVSEEGLLGLAFHPDFEQNGRIFLNYVASSSTGRDVSRVAEWRVTPGADLRSAKPKAHKVIMEVAQPYQNHDAGQLAFGPDGMLYIGWGDGGYRADPHNHGQNTATFLGSMLRVDVNVPDDHEQGYQVPPDNPFVGTQGYAPEAWAIGFRNPWRYSFAPDGRLVVADVGQDKFEEVAIVGRGENHGWKVREARHCFEPNKDCATEGMVDPIYEYPRSEGQSITGGYVYSGSGIPELTGRYVFGDFVSGRLWAIELPATVSNDAPLAPVVALGDWPVLISTFGLDAQGEVYLADFGTGAVLQITP